MRSALFMLVSALGFSEVLDENKVVINPSHGAAQVANPSLIVASLSEWNIIEVVIEAD